MRILLAQPGDAAAILRLQKVAYQTEVACTAMISRRPRGQESLSGVSLRPLHADERCTASLISAVLGTRLPGPGAVYISQTLNFRAPVKIGDTVIVTVTVAELMPEKSRARLSCLCEVDGEVVLDGEALVKVPSEKAAKDKRPVIRL
jgi:hypothetical protein